MIDIIIVNWNSGPQLTDAFISIQKHCSKYINALVVIDNASTDNSLEQLIKCGIKSPFQVQIVHNSKNKGFAAACNQGAALGSAPYLLFLNPDTRLMAGSLEKPLAFMRASKNRKYGICGIQLINEADQVSRSCSRFPTLTRLIVSALGIDKISKWRSKGVRIAGWNHAVSRPVDQIMGAFFLIRRSVFQECNGFDERFFVYFEEVDLSFRAHLKGWHSFYLTGAQAFHTGGGASRQVKARRLFYSLRSRLLYGFKHFSKIQAWLLVLLTCGLEPVTRTLYCLVKQDLKELRNTWKGYGLFYHNLPLILRGRDLRST